MITSPFPIYYSPRGFSSNSAVKTLIVPALIPEDLTQTLVLAPQQWGKVGFQQSFHAAQQKLSTISITWQRFQQQIRNAGRDTLKVPPAPILPWHSPRGSERTETEARVEGGRTGLTPHAVLPARRLCGHHCQKQHGQSLHLPFQTLSQPCAAQNLGLLLFSQFLWNE